MVVVYCTISLPMRWSMHMCKYGSRGPVVQYMLVCICLPAWQMTEHRYMAVPSVLISASSDF
jgi:hypothetical protein